jgi:hypothetical protein
LEVAKIIKSQSESSSSEDDFVTQKKHNYKKNMSPNTSPLRQVHI